MNRYGDGISTKSKLPKKPNKKTTVVATSTTLTNIPDFWVYRSRCSYFRRAVFHVQNAISEINVVVKTERFKQTACAEYRRAKLMGRYEKCLLDDRMCNENVTISSNCAYDYDESSSYTEYRLKHHLKSQIV
ncbi:unnamed protein product [Macrosiphum euphorbiae]|nr:unnamed protein product [Macrosiphum euphorbiae]